MKFVPTINWDKHEGELAVLREAFQPIYVIEDLFADLGGADPVMDALRRVEQGGGIHLRHLRQAAFILTLLADRLESETEVEAAPEWIEQTERAKASGIVPLVTNPEVAVKVIRETRERQLRAVREGQRLLKASIRLLERANAAFGPDEEDEGVEDDIVYPRSPVSMWTGGTDS